MSMTRKGRGVFFSLMLFLIPASVFGWSSKGESTFYGLAGTHQFMCKAAHAYFKHHPAAQFYDFPGIEAIISYSGVNTKQEGKGPDNPQKSNYSDHWYNALARQMSLPRIIMRSLSKFCASWPVRMIVIPRQEKNSARKQQSMPPIAAIISRT